MSQLLPYQQRVVDECGALVERLEALSTFLDSDASRVVPDYDRTLLEGQASATATYLVFLNLRIERFVS